MPTTYGTRLETAKFRYLMERSKTLKMSTYGKELGVLAAFAKMTGKRCARKGRGRNACRARGRVNKC